MFLAVSIAREAVRVDQRLQPNVPRHRWRPCGQRNRRGGEGACSQSPEQELDVNNSPYLARPQNGVGWPLYTHPGIIMHDLEALYSSYETLCSFPRVMAKLERIGCADGGWMTRY